MQLQGEFVVLGARRGKFDDGRTWTQIQVINDEMRSSPDQWGQAIMSMPAPYSIVDELKQFPEGSQKLLLSLRPIVKKDKNGKEFAAFECTGILGAPQQHRAKGG
jgi:hypothetical protein